MTKITDSTEIILASDWQTTDNWFGSDLVVLRPLKKLSNIDTTGLSKEEELKRLSESRQNMVGERIQIRSNGQLKYSNGLYCPVGEIVRRLKTFKFYNSRVFVEYKELPWNQDFDNYDSCSYSVVKWTSEEIVLKLIK